MADAITSAFSVLHAGLPPLHAFFAPLGGIKQLCVDARLLHSHLKINLKFSQWFHAKVQKHGFQADTDWQYVPHDSSLAMAGMCPTSGDVVKESRMGRPCKNYLVSLELAKGLSLLESNSESYGVWKQLIQQELWFSNALTSSSSRTASNDYIRITTTQAQELKELVHAHAQKTQQSHQSIWAQFQHNFAVNSYLELPAEKFESAHAYLTALLETDASKTPSLEPRGLTLEKDIQAKILALAADVITSVGDALRKNQLDLEKYTLQPA
ncbi:antA/AntB antirepressor family protein [Macromonas bipunctata]|uniref:antA/AntB antirepressor family protein n=1 Tax=Macromonas bipunctata TaxID=183670 RepID=UPI000C33176A|nr:antA/AntB antirepressor family protein [Macromonas bipunctata]